MSEIDWARGIGYSIAASLIGGASKLAIRKSWLIERSAETLHNEVASTTKVGKMGDASSSPTVDHACSGSVQLCMMAITDNNTKASKENEHPSDYVMHHSVSSDSVDTESVTSRSANAHIIETKRTHQIALGLRLSGMVGMTFLNPLLCILAMNYASPSILAPFSGLTLVWIILFAEVIIGERPNRIQVLAVFLIILGEVIVAIWGDHTNDEGVSIEEVVMSYKNEYFQLYNVLFALWMLAISYIILRKSPTSPSLRRFAWGVSGGSITGLQNFLKDSLTIMKAVKAEDDDMLSYPWCFYIMIFLGSATAFGGLFCLTACMKRYDATFSSATFVGSFVISASIMSAVHYDTFQHLLGIWNWILYPAGLGVLMLGVILLVWQTTDTDIESTTGAYHVVCTNTTPFISNSEEDNEEEEDRVHIVI